MANANEAHVFNLANASSPFLANANEARGFNLVGACLCSPGPMFPGSYVPGPRVLCSPGPMFPGSYVPRVLCSPGPMFPSLYETGEHRTLFFFFKKGPMIITCLYLATFLDADYLLTRTF